MQALKNQSFTRRQYDGCKTNDDVRVTTGPGRYQIDTPPQYCNASFAPEPTIRQQRWGASLNGSFAKTDVESDLLNINRPTTKTICSQYDPTTDEVNQGGRTDMKEQSFPQTFSRLVDPPSTGRAVGWNRWEWLCENPQESIMMPFDWNITTRLSAKDSFRPCIPTPIGPAALLPAPTAFEPKTGGLLPGLYAEQTASTARVPPLARDIRVAGQEPQQLATGVNLATRNPPSTGWAPPNFLAMA